MQSIIIAGTHSGCGKTTVTLGLMAALRKRGLTVQPFKTGPDFIDAGLHRLVTERQSRNLDLWMCSNDVVINTFRNHTQDVDIAVIEGVMGMYDGEASTARLAEVLGVPVILVVDAYGMAESAGAVVKGFIEYGHSHSGIAPNHDINSCALGGVNIGGVIFNRVASETHYERLKASVRDVPVVGYLPRDLHFEIPHRHLGLMIAEELPIAEESIRMLADTMLAHVDISRILAIAAHNNPRIGSNVKSSVTLETKLLPHFKIGVAYDQAFCFYYEDNLDLLRDAGADIVRFSPLAEREIPADVGALYLGGGYPELHAEALSKNSSMIASIQAWCDTGKPLYAECGGLMYLCRSLHDFDGNVYPMVDVFPFETRMTQKPTLGYREIILNEDCILGNAGETCRGHEFHYSEIIDSAVGTVYSLHDHRGNPLPSEGFRRKNTLASYVHVHFGSNRNIADQFRNYSLENL
jgi:cobyrinic acid a,c-diamide synthase